MTNRPRLTSRETSLVNRIKNGEDVRAWAVNHTTMFGLLRKNVIECHATTCRLTLRAAPHQHGAPQPEHAP